jgi:hypothetical protein
LRFVQIEHNSDGALAVLWRDRRARASVFAGPASISDNAFFYSAEYHAPSAAREKAARCRNQRRERASGGRSWGWGPTTGK